MANPGVPQPRKNATSGFNPKNAGATSNDTAGKSAYKRQSATPFSNPKKGDLLKRTSAGLSPGGQPVGDHDAGNNMYRKNNTSGQNMSKSKLKGVD